jgi:hypothetical protein
MATEIQYEVDGNLKVAARHWLDETWRELRNGAGPARMAYMGGAIDMLKDLGILNAEEQEGWIARRSQCPGHDDEGGRDWCAYGCDMQALRAAGEAM